MRESRFRKGAVLQALFCVSVIMVTGHRAARVLADEVPQPLFQLSIEELLDLPVHVSSTNPGSVLENPSSVQVIEQSTIEAHGFTSLADALSTVAGIHLYNTNFTRDMVTARGALQFNYVNKVLIMVDGIPVFEPSSGDGVLNRVSIADVERIEILKGPASVRYGTNAYSGSVNLVLKKRATSGVEGRVGVGYANRYESGVRAFYRKGKLGVSASVNHLTERRRSYDFPALNNGMPYRYREEYEYKNATVSLDYGSHRLLLNHFDNIFPFLGVQVDLASGAGLARQFQGTLATYLYERMFSDAWLIRANVAYEYYARENFRDDMRSHILLGRSQRGFATVSVTRRFSSLFSLELGGDGGLLHGIGLEDRTFADNVVTDGYGLSGRKLWHGSVFGFANLVYRPFHLTVGSRYTHAQGFGGDLSSTGNLVLQTSSRTSVKLNVGQSFRWPSLLELYWGPLANPKLHSERALSYELAFVGQPFDNFMIQVTGYYGDYYSFINRVTTMDPVTMTSSSRYGNVDEHLNGLGVEAELRYRLPGAFDAYASYGFLDGSKKESSAPLGYPFRYVPKHTLAAGVSRVFLNHFHLSVRGLYWHSTHGFLGRIPPQHRLDASVGYSHDVDGLRWRHSIAAQNLTDQDFLQAEYTKLTTTNTVPTEASGLRVLYMLSIAL